MSDNEPPNGYTREDWANLCCCVCMGCRSVGFDHEHTCYRSPEERLAMEAMWDEDTESNPYYPGPRNQ